MGQTCFLCSPTASFANPNPAPIPQCLVGGNAPWTFAALPDSEAGPSSAGAVVGIAVSGNDGDAAAVPGPSGFGAKRVRSEDEEDGEDDDGSGGSGSGGGGGATASGACASGRRPIGRKGKPMSREAVAKSHREKARRERLNDGFEELSRLCDPSGKVVKSDRVSIVQGGRRVAPGGALLQPELQNPALARFSLTCTSRHCCDRRPELLCAPPCTLLALPPHPARPPPPAGARRPMQTPSACCSRYVLRTTSCDS